MKIKLDSQKENQLARFCERWHIEQVEVFGPILKEFAKPEERINVLLTFAANTSRTLGDRMNMELGLQKLFAVDRQVDIYSHAGIDRSIMPHHRQNILDEESILLYPLAGIEKMDNLLAEVK